MIGVKTNITEIITKDIQFLHSLADVDRMLRTIATTVLGDMKIRIHREGRDASGKQIGTYSPGYMKVRTGNFTNASTFKKGSKKGQFKTEKKIGEAGLFSKGKNKGKPRPIYNRDNNPTVIFSLTRQMENDFKVKAIDAGYGLGFDNSENFKKANYCEETYYGKEGHGKVFSLSEEELTVTNKIIDKFLSDALPQ